MGTTYHIVVSSEVAKNERELLHRDIDALLLNLNQSFSTYIESSEVSQLNQYTGNEGQVVSADFIEVLSEALQISELTQGAYDITVGPLVNLWGFGPTFKADELPSPSDISKNLLNTGYKNIVLDEQTQQVIKLNPSVYIDFSSIAKGFGVDKVAALLESEGYFNYMVEIGGEMYVRGVNPDGNHWRIAIEKPDTTARSIHKVINVSDIAIATSGDYRNFFEKDGVKFSHTIDPTTGQPVIHSLASVTVLSKSSMTADAWATAFMVLGSKKGYDLAIENKIAVLFLVKEGEGLKEIESPEFQSIIKEQVS